MKGARSMGQKILMAFVFLAIFVGVHLTGDLIPVRTPFFGVSESVWEHLKMGFWSYGITYSIFWAARRRGSLSGLFSGTLFALGAIFILYYTSLNLGALPGRLPLALDIALVSLITFVSGLLGAEAGDLADSTAASGGFLVASGILWVLLLILFIVYTYHQPPLPLFLEPAL